MSTISEFFKQKGAVQKLGAAALVIAVIGFGLGRISVRKSTDNKRPASVNASPTKAGTVWTCSMHPQIRQPEPGKCPICGMTLIPATSGSDELGPRMMNMSEASLKLAEVETATVNKRYLDLEIPMVGLIAYDETRVKTIAAWMPGRLDRLFVDYTGIAVNKGDHMVEIYSPDLFAAQEELLQALAATGTMASSSSESVKRSTQRMLKASREKLRLLGLTADQIAAIEKSKRASATLRIDAPTSGIVIHKNAEQGMYVKTGTPIYKVADLSMVWLQLDAYESDIAWIRYGQEVEVKTESYGDRVFKGRISFIDPVLDPKTRSVKVRVNVSNEKGLLKPNMFVRAMVRVRIGDKGKLAGKQEMAGKWICPMHPEVVRDAPGKCNICSMVLVTAESLGLVNTLDVGPALAVPATAVLTTGKRAVVYVRVPNRHKPTFQGLEIKVGPKAGNYYVVLSGLEEGQDVVTMGNFKIDSALQLLAKPSMMSPKGGFAPRGHTMHGKGMKMKMKNSPTKRTNRKKEKVKVTPAFLKELDLIYTEYLKAQEALVADNEKDARVAMDALFAAVGRVNMGLAKGSAHMQWMKISGELKESLKQRKHVQGIAGLRKIFIGVSQVVLRMEKVFGHTGSANHRIAFCPMANDNKGALWLQRGTKVQNPYLGSAMPGCGEIRMTIAGADSVAADKGE